jgi:hypothetical protein
MGRIQSENDAASVPFLLGAASYVAICADCGHLMLAASILDLEASGFQFISRLAQILSDRLQITSMMIFNSTGHLAWQLGGDF